MRERKTMNACVYTLYGTGLRQLESIRMVAGTADAPLTNPTPLLKVTNTNT